MRSDGVSPNCPDSAESLRERLVDLVPVFVLVDPFVGEPLLELQSPPPEGLEDMQRRREEVWGRPVATIDLTHTTLPPHLYPYVVELNGRDDVWLDATFEMALIERERSLADGLNGRGEAAHRIGGWLQSSMYPQQLARQVSPLMRLRTEQMYNAATYLRLGDRRALGLLRHVVGDERIVGHFGRIQSWSYLDVRGHLSSLQASHESASQQLCLSRHEWKQMQQGADVACMLAQWQGEAQLRLRGGDGAAQAQLEQLPLKLMYELAFKALQLAEQAASQWKHRFTRPADKTIWATLSILHPDLPENDGVRRYLAAAGTPNDPPEPVRDLQAELVEKLRAQMPSRV